MPKPKSPRTTKAKAEKTEKRAVQMPEATGGGNGNHFSADLESEIRMRAYQLYEKRGYTNGRSEDDWFQAEREVMARHAHAHTA
jgi:Protein of unknown function (DUF2934)